MPFKEERIGGQRLILGDCREVMKTLGPVDAVVTSPPYGQQRDYGQKINDWRGLVGTALSMTPSHSETQVLCNLGIIHNGGRVLPYWNDLFFDMDAQGWRLFGWYVWDKGFGAPGDFGGRFAPAHEFVFHFNKNGRAISKWIPTQQRKASGTGMRKADGSMSGLSSPDKCGQPFKFADSVIRTPPQQARGGLESGHPAVFPVSFAEKLILSISYFGETILEPFMGSGTTLVACQKLGRAGIGIEIDPDYFAIACKRVEEATRQPDLFVAPPSQPVQEGFDL